jgi:hypothetical protein
LEKQHAQTLVQAQERAVKLEGYLVQISQKAGVDGRLFGSVTAADISEALKAQGFEVAKAEVRLPNGPLKQVGDHPLVIALHSDVTAHHRVGARRSIIGRPSSRISKGSRGPFRFAGEVITLAAAKLEQESRGPQLAPVSADRQLDVIDCRPIREAEQSVLVVCCSTIGVERIAKYISELDFSLIVS